MMTPRLRTSRPCLRVPALLACALAIVSPSLDAQEAAPKPAPKPAYPNETDPDSPRRSKLDPSRPDEILRIDATGDGKPDVIERWVGGRRVRFFDEAGATKPEDTFGDTINGAMQVDVDGDGYFDGPKDYTIKWADRDSDGIADIEAYNSNPKPGFPSVFGPSGAVFYMTIDPDNTGMLADLDWKDVSVDWTRWDTPTNWRPNYHGNATFLKEHAPIWAVETPEFTWENPFLFFDPDGDGLSEVSIRVADNRAFVGPGQMRLRFDGIVDEAWVSYDLDNNTGWGTTVSYDLTLYVAGKPGVDYSNDINEFPQLKAPEWAAPYYRNFDWRRQTRFRFIPRENAIQRLFGAQWEKAWITFDEDGDCYRWERVELYYPGDPYLLERNPPKAGTKSIIRNTQSDSLGDRGEWDEDFSGKGHMYRAAWDGKIHLCGAESGAWLVDRDAAFNGSAHYNGRSPKEAATKVAEVIQYRDTNNSGWINQVIYDYDGDGQADRTDNLEELGVDTKGPVLDVTKMDWEALRKENAEAVNRSWREAQRMFHAALRHDFVDDAILKLIKAPSVGEKYRNAYRLKEDILRKVLAAAPTDQHRDILKAYYTNNVADLEKLMAAVRAKP
ncbi:MAG: hypothetical protein FGM15_10970 [Chthoniobacterales bacterium]|nr:hypothetical protein [Chthoniobacterales bacterium]